MIIGGGEETPINVIKSCEMGVPLSGAFDISGSLHLGARKAIGAKKDITASF